MKKLVLASAFLIAGCFLNAEQKVAAPENNKRAGIWEISEVDFNIGLPSDGSISNVTLQPPNGFECPGIHTGNPYLDGNSYKFLALLTGSESVANHFQSNCINSSYALALKENGEFPSSWPEALTFYIKGSFNVTFNDNSTATCPFVVGLGSEMNWWWMGTECTGLLPRQDGVIYLPCYKNDVCCGFIKVEVGNALGGNTFYLTDFASSLPLWDTNTSGYPNAQLVMQGDGNLVISDAGPVLWETGTGSNNYSDPELIFDYATGQLEVVLGVNNNDPWQVLWHSTGFGDSYRMQDDGNLVVYIGNTPVWASGTGGNSGARLVLQDDGNLVIYGHGGIPQMLWHTNTTAGNIGAALQFNNGDLQIVYEDREQNLIWDTNTSGRGASWAMQGDGNLIVYDGAKNPIWASGTSGYQGAYYKLAGGDLQIWWNNPVIWASNTGGNPGAGAPYTKIMLGNGNLVICDKDENQIWASGTSGYSGAWDAFQSDGNYVIYWGDSSAGVDKP